MVLKLVATGSPSRGGDVAVYVFDINQPSLSTPFYSVLVSISIFMALSTVFHSINSLDNSPRSQSVLQGFISALLVLSTMYLFMKVSFSPRIILSDRLGLKSQLTNFAATTAQQILSATSFRTTATTSQPAKRFDAKTHSLSMGQQ